MTQNIKTIKIKITKEKGENYNMDKTYGAVRESHTLENSSKALFECVIVTIIKKYQDMVYLCNFEKSKII